MNSQRNYSYFAAPVVLALVAALGAFLLHAAILIGTLSVYSALSAVPSVPVSLGLIIALPFAVTLFALALFIKYAQPNTAWQAVALALLALCAFCQFILTPFLSCFASRSFCL
jgi:hypothetical protein